jgi:hypothetical protein
MTDYWSMFYISCIFVTLVTSQLHPVKSKIGYDRNGAARKLKRRKMSSKWNKPTLKN